jgi:hypothetical protein
MPLLDMAAVIDQRTHVNGSTAHKPYVRSRPAAVVTQQFLWRVAPGWKQGEARHSAMQASCRCAAGAWLEGHDAVGQCTAGGEGLQYMKSYTQPLTSRASSSSWTRGTLRTPLLHDRRTPRAWSLLANLCMSSSYRGCTVVRRKPSNGIWVGSSTCKKRGRQLRQ